MLTIATPRYDRGFVSCRRSLVRGFELIERIEIDYRMANETPMRIEVPPGAAFATESGCAAAQLDYR